MDLRFPDPSANPYLAIAVCLAAGIDGLERKLDPGMEAPGCYETENEIEQLPGTLREAVAWMNGDSFIEGVLGKEFCEIYADAKMEEWDNYMEQVSQWELDEYLYRI